MIFPCIDLMEGKVVQLVQGRDKALEGEAPLEMLRKFAAFPEIQVIDLDAAMGKGENSVLVEMLAGRARCRVGGGVRTPERARRLLEQGAHRVIVGTAAFTPVMQEIAAAVGPEKILIALDSKDGKIVVKGWQESTNLTAEDVIHHLEPLCGGFLCTYVDKEGMLQGTDLEWFRRLRATTTHEITAAGGITTMEEIRELHEMNVHAALGMAIYTGRLDLAELAKLNMPREIVLSGKEWREPEDFYRAILGALGAPAWHGHNLDALWDSIAGDDVNSVKAPYRIRLVETDELPVKCGDVVNRFVALIAEAKRVGSQVDIERRDSASQPNAL